MGQRAPVQMGFRFTVEGVAQDLAQVARERVWHHTLTLDDAGVAV